MSVFQDLYDSEINFTVSCFWDSGFRIELGDELNGLKAEATVDTWEDVEHWLIGYAMVHYPDSVFAKKCRTQ